jgi:hypothetical protein
MGAKFAIAAVLASGAYELWRLRAGGTSLGGALVSLLVTTFVSASTGKVLGIALYRYRHGRFRRTSVAVR